MKKIVFSAKGAQKKRSEEKSSLRRKQFAVDVVLVDRNELELRSVLNIDLVKTLFIVHVAQVYDTGSGRHEDAKFDF